MSEMEVEEALSFSEKSSEQVTEYLEVRIPQSMCREFEGKKSCFHAVTCYY